MKTAYAILIVIFNISLAGCVLSGKPKPATPPAPQPVAAPTPAPPPPPLSMPQTEIQLPPPQPVDLDALTLAPQPEAPAEAPPAGRTNARPPRPKPQPPAVPVETVPAPTLPQPETERGTAREVLPLAESNKLRNAADANKQTIRAWLNTNKIRRLSPNHPTIAKIRSLLQASDDAELKGDIREASDLADRAMLFMRELQK